MWVGWGGGQKAQAGVSSVLWAFGVVLGRLAKGHCSVALSF